MTAHTTDPTISDARSITTSELSMHNEVHACNVEITNAQEEDRIEQAALDAEIAAIQARKAERRKVTQAAVTELRARLSRASAYLSAGQA